MTAAGLTMETGGALVGQRVGQILGGIIGEFFGPAGVPIGVVIGGRVGAVAGRAAGAYLASKMEKANEDVEKKTIAEDAAKPCLNCGEVDCFTPPKGADPDEFNKQLKEQQDTINNMKPDDLLDNMQKYVKDGRGAGDATARSQQRQDWLQERTRDLTQEYSATMSQSEAAAKAAADAAAEGRLLAATHDLDLVAGGSGNLSGMGNRSINSSIGSQWKGKRVAQLKKHAQEAKKQGKKMNVKLKNCNESNAPTDGDVPTS